MRAMLSRLLVCLAFLSGLVSTETPVNAHSPRDAEVIVELVGDAMAMKAAGFAAPHRDDTDRARTTDVAPAAVSEPAARVPAVRFGIDRAFE